LARSRSSSKAPIPASKWRVRAVLLLIALAAYVNTFALGLAQDSKTIVTADARVQAVTADNVKAILTKNYWWPKTGDGLYRPVTTLSILFNYAVLGNGPNAAGYHVLNFLLHSINVWLVYELALLLLRGTTPAFFAAALWAVHPIGTEGVTSIVGRADLLAAMAVLGGLLLYIRSRSRWAPVALFAISTLGVFAKENAAVLIGLMLLWDVSFKVKPRWHSYAAVAASLVVFALVRHVVLGALPPAEPPYVDNPLFRASFWTARWTAIKVVGLDLWLLFFPVVLSSDRSQVLPAAWSDPWVWLSLAAIVAILAAAFARYRQDPLIFWAAGFFAIALLPTSNLVILIGTAMAERFLYLPSIAFAVVVTALLYRLKNEPYAKVALVALLALYAVRTFARNPAWNDNTSLALADIPNSPRSFRLHDMLAKELYDRDTRANIDRAIQEEEIAWNLLEPLPPRESTSFAPTMLGVYYAAKADLVSPPDQKAWYQKSLAILLKAREISRAIEKDYDDVQRARGGPLLSRPANQELYLTLGNGYMHLDDYPDAVEALRYGKGIAPRTLEFYDGLVLAYSTMGDFPKAVVTMEEKALVDNFQPATMSAIRDLYQKTPEGQCAFVERAAGWEFNLAGCPRVKGDVCAAFADLAQAYRDSRAPESAEQVQTAATQRYACSVR
jgi:tetratricopeptide (TPR) repeat protein